MLSSPTPPQADSTFEEGIVGDSGTQGVEPWCEHAPLFVVVHDGEDGSVSLWGANATC